MLWFLSHKKRRIKTILALGLCGYYTNSVRPIMWKCGGNRITVCLQCSFLISNSCKAYLSDSEDCKIDSFKGSHDHFLLDVQGHISVVFCVLTSQHNHSCFREKNLLEEDTHNNECDLSPENQIKFPSLLPSLFFFFLLFPIFVWLLLCNRHCNSY